MIRCVALTSAAALLLLSSVAWAIEPHVDEHGNVHGDHSQAHLILAGLVSATFLVAGALAGRGKGGPASRRSLRPSGRGPLQKS